MQLLREIGWRGVSEWFAYATLEPFGAPARDESVARLLRPYAPAETTLDQLMPDRGAAWDRLHQQRAQKQAPPPRAAFTAEGGVTLAAFEASLRARRVAEEGGGGGDA